MSPYYIKVPETGIKVFKDYQRFIEIPCGKCPECRVSHSREWAIRCMCELESMSDIEKDRCWFITLTYDNQHNPGFLVQSDVQKFFKRLRKKYKQFKIKYFYCGEYGTNTFRPHYHVLLYNCPIMDLNPLYVTRNSDMLFTSETIASIWGKGQIAIGALTLKSAAYTARYCLKKNDTDCYMRCSQGFGKKFFLKNMKDIISNGFVSVNFDDHLMKAKIPKYFLKVYRQIVGDKEYTKFIKFRMMKSEDFQLALQKSIKVYD
ncbi:MAG: hypothetical protein KBS35_03255, partial [Mycoplasma sp.]|nr:hypothetical protein [Candidatus Hennigella equi]